MSGRSRARRGLARAAAAVVLLAGGGGTAWALQHRSGDGHEVRYASAAAMAARAGCVHTYQPTATYAGVVSAGRCRMDGGWVDFRVLPSLSAAYAWLDGAHGPSGKPEGFGVVGDGWVAHSLDRTAMVRVTRSLTS
ncbi:MAG: hypothetical protein ACJ74O_01500 [Frankiaceae bacterium]